MANFNIPPHIEQGATVLLDGERTKIALSQYSIYRGSTDYVLTFETGEVLSFRNKRIQPLEGVLPDGFVVNKDVRHEGKRAQITKYWFCRFKGDDKDSLYVQFKVYRGNQEWALRVPEKFEPTAFEFPADRLKKEFKRVMDILSKPTAHIKSKPPLRRRSAQQLNNKGGR